MSVTIKKNRKGEITITAKGRKSGVDLRNFAFGLAGMEPPKDGRAHPDTLTDEAKLRRSQALDELGALDGELMREGNAQ